jgi:hypothetical protein
VCHDFTNTSNQQALAIEAGVLSFLGVVAILSVNDDGRISASACSNASPAIG